MAIKADPATEPRIPLSRERVLRAAVEIADHSGINSLTMRRLAEELGVEAMSIYYHLENKEAVLDGMVEMIVGEIVDEVGRLDAPSPEKDWKTAMRSRILAARQVMLRHKWAPDLVESRTTMSPAIIHYFEGLLAILIRGGFTYDIAHHAMHALGSRALGFSQELFQPDDAGSEDASDQMMADLADSLPYLVAMLNEISHDAPDSTLGWCDDQTEFEFAIDLLLDGLDRLIETA